MDISISFCSEIRFEKLELHVASRRFNAQTPKLLQDIVLFAKKINNEAININQQIVMLHVPCF